MLSTKKLLYKIVNAIYAINETKYKTLLSPVDANGTYTLSYSLADVTELVFQMTIGNVTRGSVMLTVAQFKANGAFPDFTLGTLRGYCSVQYVSDTSIQITSSSLTNYGGKIRLIGK